MDSVIWFLVYLFTFFGSISFSYFLMRILHPDTRALSVHSKLQYSFYISVVSFALGIMSANLFGEVFLFVTFPIIAFLVVLVDFLIEIPKTSRRMRIAVPKYRKR